MKQWIKLYIEILSDPKMGRMSDKLFRRTIELFLLAGKEDGDGVLPSIDDIAWSLHSSTKEIQSVLDELTNLKIIERKDDKYLISNFESRQNSDLTRSEINKRYYENSKNRKSENKTEIQTEFRCDSDVTKSEIQTLEKEIEIDKEIDINTLSKDSVYTPAKKSAKPKSEKQKFGSMQNVLLTSEEYAKLCERFPDADAKIESLSLAIASKGYKYKDHYATVLNWARMDADKPKPTPKPEPKKTYSFAEVGEMLERGEIVL